MKQKTHVLIVDDQRSTREALRALLEQYQEINVVGLATNGREALQLVETYHPDVVLMDIRMPVMDGLEAIRHIKRHWPEVNIIALTMYPSNHTEAIIAGADQFLIKGCTSKLLIAAISKTMHRNGQANSIHKDYGELAT